MFVDRLWVMFGVKPLPGFPHGLLVSYKTSTPARMGMILDPPLLSGRPIMKFTSEWCHCQQQQQQQVFKKFSSSAFCCIPYLAAPIHTHTCLLAQRGGDRRVSSDFSLLFPDKHTFMNSNSADKVDCITLLLITVLKKIRTKY